MVNIKGIWLFNKNLEVPSWETISVNFINSFNEICTGFKFISQDLETIICTQSESTKPIYHFNNEGWEENEENYRIIEFIGEC
jgi:hypothetical protein